MMEAGRGRELGRLSWISLHRRFWAMSEPTTTPVTRVIPASSHFLKLSWDLLLSAAASCPKISAKRSCHEKKGEKMGEERVNHSYLKLTMWYVFKFEKTHRHSLKFPFQRTKRFRESGRFPSVKVSRPQTSTLLQSHLQLGVQMTWTTHTVTCGNFHPPQKSYRWGTNSKKTPKPPASTLNTVQDFTYEKGKSTLFHSASGLGHDEGSSFRTLCGIPSVLQLIPAEPLLLLKFFPIVVLRLPSLHCRPLKSFPGNQLHSMQYSSLAKGRCQTVKSIHKHNSRSAEQDTAHWVTTDDAHVVHTLKLTVLHLGKHDQSGWCSLKCKSW